MCKFVIYQDKQGEYRFRFKAANGEIIAVSSESYVKKAPCVDAINLIRSNCKDAKIVDETE